MMEMASNGKERRICEIVDLLVIVALMFRIEEQGKHFCYTWLFSCSVLVSSSFDFLLLLFVLNALFMVLLCFFLVVNLKLPHVLLFSSFYFWCIVLIISSFLLIVKPICHVLSTSSLVFWCLFLVVKLMSCYLVFCQLHLLYSCVFFWSSV
jgi:hypothetical protein